MKTCKREKELVQMLRSIYGLLKASARRTRLFLDSLNRPKHRAIEIQTSDAWPCRSEHQRETNTNSSSRSIPHSQIGSESTTSLCSWRFKLRIATRGIDDLRGTCNDLEQYSRRSALRSDMHTASLQRAGSHSPGENTYIIVTKVAEVMGIDLEIDEISVSHRLKTSKSYHGKNAKPPPIIAKFVRCNTKENSAKQGKLCTQTPLWPKSLGSAMSRRARSLL